MSRIERVPYGEEFEIRKNARCMDVSKGYPQHRIDWSTSKFGDSGDPVTAEDIFSTQAYVFQWQDRKGTWVFYKDGDWMVKHWFPDETSAMTFLNLLGYGV